MAMRNFKYLQKEPSKPVSCSGSRYRVKNELKQDGNNYRLVEVGKIDIQEQISSYEDSVDLGKMIERFRRGDTTALERRSGQYLDVSGLPNDARALIEQTRDNLRAQMAAAAATPAAAPAADPVVNNDGGDPNAQTA